MNIIDFTTGAQVTPTRRFARPVSIKINEEAFNFEPPKKKKNAADPLKDVADINEVVDYFLSTGQYRNNLLFIMGINFGLRCGDLLQLKLGHILNSDSSFRGDVRIQEEKTKKIRTCYMNDAIMDAAELYLCDIQEKTGGALNLNDYLFKSLSNNDSVAYYDTLRELGEEVKRTEGSSITVRSVERMLKDVVNKKLGININAGTHMLRKTFAYHVIINAPDRSRAIEFLQKIFGHSSQSITLAYAGITDEEVRTTCQNLNLGYKGMDFCYSAGLAM